MEEEFVTTAELGIKWKSKKEVYQVMTTQGNVYLPTIKLSNHDYVAGILEGTTKVSASKNNAIWVVH